MGLGSLLGGGGSQSTKVKIPQYVRKPSEYIGNSVFNLMQDPAQNQFTSEQQTALDRIIGQAMGGAGYQPGSQNFLSDLFANNGLTTGQDALARGLIGGGYVNPAMGETARVAMGGDVGRNPFLDSAFGRAAGVMGENFQDNVLADMDSGFAASGRLGSKAYAKARGSAEDAYGRQLNDLANEVYGGAYQSDMARKDAALGQLAGLGQQDVQNRLSGAGLYQQGIGNRFGGISAMPTVDASRYSDAERLFQAGNTIRGLPWESLRIGSDIVGRLQAPASTTTSTNPNPFGQLMGYGIAGLGAMGGGAGLAALMASDRRLKRDIRRIGELPSGLPVYRFRYVWDDVEHVGVMAQEAVHLFPEAVHEIGAYLAVDYGRIG